MNFQAKLLQTLSTNNGNQYGKENYDEISLGKYPFGEQSGTSPRVRFWLNIYHSLVLKKPSEEVNQFLIDYGDGLQLLYENLPRKDRALLVKIIAFHLLGFRKIKLPTNTAAYWRDLKRCESLVLQGAPYPTYHFMHHRLDKMNLAPIGYDISLYYVPIGVMLTYLHQQYAYENHHQSIKAKASDVVIDCGACLGDTSLYFSSLVREDGKVLAFEFMPRNIEVFKENLRLNPKLAHRIKLIAKPLSEKNDETVYFNDQGPASIVRKSEFDGYEGKLSANTIDSVVRNKSIDRIDFMKMDIEGSELPALRGAIESIKRFKPKLAIAIYHSFEDFINIPKWILDLDLGYKIYLDHYTIHRGETILYACVEG